ncbi:hypothetical protein ACQ4PT_030280 [Festuca glaucescens]
MAATPRRCREARPTTLLALADELLEEIFLRLPAAADLARASMAGVSFRRLIADHRFLRRFRAGHLPPLLGVVPSRHRQDDPTHLAQPPHPCAAAAITLAGFHAADFSCSFLPSPKRWHRRDLRDGRVLLSGVPHGGRFDCRVLVRELAVCDPLYRRYVLLPAIPDDLAASVVRPLPFEPFLAPPLAEDKEGMSFRVICLAQCATKLVLFIFSRGGAGAEQWRSITFDNWAALIAGDEPETCWWPRMRHYAHGSFCWAFYPKGKLIMLDTRTMDFSAVDLPPGSNQMQVIILEAGNGRLGMFMNEYLTRELSYVVLRNDGHGANQWQSEAMFSLPLNQRNMLMGVAGGYLLIHGIPETTFSFPWAEREDVKVFSLNLKTLQLELFFASKYCVMDGHLFAGFPPSLSPPTI